jgi:hypothetical protein
MCLIPASEEGFPQHLRKNEFVGRHFGVTGDWRCALDHFRVADRPLIGLRRAHGAAHDQFQPLEAKFFRDQLALGPHVIADSDAGELYPVEWSWRVPI